MLVAPAVVALGIAAASPGIAVAQGGSEPYSGGAPGSPPGCATPDLHASTTTVHAGDVITVAVSRLTPRSSAELTFAGQDVGSGTASNGPPCQGSFSTPVIVPKVGASHDPLCALSAGQPPSCEEIQVVASGFHTGGLAFTGSFLLLLVIAGIAAILVGWFLLSRARRRRRREAWG
jgi:hypothetical protein